jgi:hypothetical protein
MASRTRTSFSIILGFVLAVGVFTLVGSAQKNDKEAARTTVTGCLQKGDEADVFALTGENGKNYELVTRNVKLSVHVGHKVRVTGALIEEESEQQEREAGEGWAGKIYVTSLKVVSETCKSSEPQ